MALGTIQGSAASVLESISGARDALSVRRVFGEPIEIGGVTVIPVARVAGGVGGGGGEGTDAGNSGTSGTGFGTGFGLSASPVGVYEIRDGQAEWKPAVDVTRLVHGFQVLAGIVAVCVTLVRRRRRS
jgi:uncharacterized spore protein YtfJ